MLVFHSCSLMVTSICIYYIQEHCKRNPEMMTKFGTGSCTFFHVLALLICLDVVLSKGAFHWSFHHLWSPCLLTSQRDTYWWSWGWWRRCSSGIGVTSTRSGRQWWWGWYIHEKQLLHIDCGSISIETVHVANKCANRNEWVVVFWAIAAVCHKLYQQLCVDIYAAKYFVCEGLYADHVQKDPLFCNLFTYTLFCITDFCYYIWMHP